jgi:hypothetical protein
MYFCRGLKKRVVSYYDIIEEHMEQSIGKVCRLYDESMFGKIFDAYCLLDKCELFFEKLTQHMLTCINVISTEALVGALVNAFVVRENLTTNSRDNLLKVNTYIEELKRKDFAQLYELISNEDYRTSLIHMCLNLWQLMKNYYRMCTFINNNCFNSKTPRGGGAFDNYLRMTSF